MLSIVGALGVIDSVLIGVTAALAVAALTGGELWVATPVGLAAFAAWVPLHQRSSWPSDTRPTRRSSTCSTTEMADHRAVFDFRITFTNGGEINGRDFRLDVPGPDVGAAAAGLLLVRHLGLLMVDHVELDPSGSSRSPPGRPGGRGRSGDRRRIVDLSHPIHATKVTHPGLPGPEITDHLTRAAADPAATALDDFVDLESVVVRVARWPARPVDAARLAPYDVGGRAVPRPRARRHWAAPGVRTGQPLCERRRRRGGWRTRAPHWSGSTRSTSTTSTTAVARPTRAARSRDSRCGPPARARRLPAARVPLPRGPARQRGARHLPGPGLRRRGGGDVSGPGSSSTPAGARHPTVLDAPSNLGLRPPVEGGGAGVLQAGGSAARLRARDGARRGRRRPCDAAVVTTHTAGGPVYGVFNAEAMPGDSRSFCRPDPRLARRPPFPIVLGGDCTGSGRARLGRCGGAAASGRRSSTDTPRLPASGQRTPCRGSGR